MINLKRFAKNANFVSVAGVRKIAVFNVSIVKNATFSCIFQVKAKYQGIG